NTWAPLVPMAVGDNALVVHSSLDGNYTVQYTRRQQLLAGLRVLLHTKQGATYPQTDAWSRLSPAYALGEFAFAVTVPNGVNIIDLCVNRTDFEDAHITATL